MDYSFYSFYCLDSLEIRLDHNSTYYRSLSKNSDVKARISHCDSHNLQYKTHPEFWPSHRRIFKTSLYYKTRLILETRRYILFPLSIQHISKWIHVQYRVPGCSFLGECAFCFFSDGSVFVLWATPWICFWKRCWRKEGTRLIDQSLPLTHYGWVKHKCVSKLKAEWCINASIN